MLLYAYWSDMERPHSREREKAGTMDDFDFWRYPLMGLPEKLLWVSVGGALGTLFRVLITHWTMDRWGPGFPYGTLMVNFGGSFLLGFLVALSLNRTSFSPELLAFLGAGFCGAFTTVSTFSVETIQLAQHHGIGFSVLNIVLNNTLAIGGALIGMFTARTLSS